MSFLFGCPSSELTLRCVWAPNLQMCLALHWGAQLADVRTCLTLQTCGLALHLRCGRALGRPTCGRGLCCVWAPILSILQAKKISYPSSSSSFSLVLPCVDVCVAYQFFVWAPILRMCPSYPSSSSSFFLVLPCEDVFVADEFFIWVPILRSRLVLRLGAQLADVPCVALGRPTCGRALCCVWAPIFRTCLALRWGPQPW
jgi:hypothetical protein